MGLEFSSESSCSNPLSPDFEELSNAESLGELRSLYKNKYSKEFLSDDDLLRQICEDWSYAAEKVFFSTMIDSPLEETEIYKEVKVGNINYRLLGIMHDAPVDESLEVIKSKEKFLELRRVEHQNARFTKGLAQADLEDIIAATEGCEVLFSEDNFDHYFNECGLRDISKKLIPLNDSELIFAALLPEISLGKNPLIDGVLSRGFLSLLSGRHNVSINCFDIPELDAKKLFWQRYFSSKDPAGIAVAVKSESPADSRKVTSDSSGVEILCSPGINLLNEVFGAESRAEATHFLARLPQDLFYGYLITKIPGLRCAPPTRISDEITQRDRMKQFSATLRSAVMALTLLKLQNESERESKVGVLLGRGHAAEVAFYLKNPPKSDHLNKLAEISAKNIKRFQEKGGEDKYLAHIESRVTRYRMYAAGYLWGVCVDSVAAIALAIWTAKQMLHSS